MFWAVGTSLVGVAERHFVESFLKKGGIDIRIILPDVEGSTLSLHQLKEYDKNSPMVSRQVGAARSSYTKLLKKIRKVHAGDVGRYLRSYPGILYSNITIFDDDAFISFYDSVGLGDANLTVHFNRQTNTAGFDRVKEEFERMWKSSRSG